MLYGTEESERGSQPLTTGLFTCTTRARVTPARGYMHRIRLLLGQLSLFKAQSELLHLLVRCPVCQLRLV